MPLDFSAAIQSIFCSSVGGQPGIACPGYSSALPAILSWSSFVLLIGMVFGIPLAAYILVWLVRLVGELTS